MPPGVVGSAASGSGASRVHSTNPSGAGSPDATPRLNGSPWRQAALLPAPLPATQPTSAGAATSPAAPQARRRKARRVGAIGHSRACRALMRAPFRSRERAAQVSGNREPRAREFATLERAASSVDSPAMASDHGMAGVIETARLALRRHRRDDLDACAAMWGDPIVTRHIGGKPFSAEEVWARLLRYAGHWSLMGFGYWVIEEKSSGRFVGEVGVADLKRTIAPSFGGAPEIGWALSAWAHGAGFATDAVGAAIS